MKVLNLSPIDNYFIDDISLAIGYFDGVHVAHQKLLTDALHLAKEFNLKSAVVTFYPDPWEVIKEKEFELLTSLSDKLNIFKEMNFDYCLVFDFNSFRKVDKDKFLDFLFDIGCKYLTCGFDFKYGYLGKGDSRDLEKYANFKTNVVDKIGDVEKTSTTMISELIINGNIKKTNELLGRLYSIKGEVIKGRQIGRTLGFPTANIKLDFEYLIPMDGVYIGEISVKDEMYRCLINIGKNPTFDLQYRSIEVLISEFNDDIYGENVVVYFKDFLRTEIKFSSVEELIEQISEDYKSLN